jgi:hypothetical protein
VFRILGNYCVGALGPRVALPCGAAAGLLGYGSMAAATALAPSAVGPGVTAACLALVGLSETITALQFFCKKTYAADPVILRSNLLRLVSGAMCKWECFLHVSTFATTSKCNVCMSHACAHWALSCSSFLHHVCTGSPWCRYAITATPLRAQTMHLSCTMNPPTHMSTRMHQQLCLANR